MNTQDMKVQALRAALDHQDQRGEVEVVNFNRTWTMKCHCYQLTQFSFYLYQARGDGWHPHCDITEEQAKCFLYAMGLDH
jgi:hypothetical protein